MSEIRTLRDGDIDVLPRTVASAVQTADGSTVEDKLNSAGGSGKRTVRFTIGTSTNGWTSADCDYLCDGTDDQIEINNAIQALPTTGGEIKILDGTYNITATISVNKNNVKISGNGATTILKRMWDSSSKEGVITSTGGQEGCCINYLQIDGNKTVYTNFNNCGIFIQSKNNIITKIISNNNNYGIYLSDGDNNTITGNTCNSNNTYSIYLFNTNNNIITGNICNSNDTYGIHLSNSDNNTITSNTCNSNDYGIYLSNSEDNTITGNTCISNNNYGIYLQNFNNNNTITGNTCVSNNNYGISLSNSEDNTITGNTCNSNGYGIYLSNSNTNDNNTITGNMCNDNTYQGIYMSCNNCVITGNICNNNDYGMYLSNADNNTITGNTCNNNNTCGINIAGDNNTITGNTCLRGTGQTSDYTSSQYTIKIGTASNYNLIANNIIMGKNVVNQSTSGGNSIYGNKWNDSIDIPKITNGTSDLTAGVSELPTGQIYLVYE